MSGSFDKDTRDAGVSFSNFNIFSDFEVLGEFSGDFFRVESICVSGFNYADSESDWMSFLSHYFFASWSGTPTIIVR